MLALKLIPMVIAFGSIILCALSAWNAASGRVVRETKRNNQGGSL